MRVRYAGPLVVRPSLAAHLVEARLAGDVATSPANTLEKCRRLAAADPRSTFGLFPPDMPTREEAVEAIRRLCGDPRGTLAAAVATPAAAPAPTPELEGPGWIDVESTLAAIEVHRSRLSELAARRGSVLFATGHPTGLLGHYGALARALASEGCTIVRMCDDDPLPEGGEPDVTRARPQVRFVDAVACVRVSGDLIHTHRPDAMQMLLDAADRMPIGLVVADHGMAGAAIARGIPTLSIADVNDPALPVAQVRGLTDGVLVIDDNLAPRLFEPVTAAMLAW